jgi:hypothetical protein
MSARPLEIKPPIMPPAAFPAPILLKARAASRFSVFSKMSAARATNSQTVVQNGWNKDENGEE